MSTIPFNFGTPARYSAMNAFSQDWGRQRDRDLPRWESTSSDLNTEKTTDFATPTADRADFTYFEQLLGLRDVRHLDSERRTRRNLLLRAFAQFVSPSAPVNFFQVPTATETTPSNSENDSLIRYLVLRTTGYLQSAAFQTDDYAHPLESHALRAWALRQGLSTAEFQLLCQLDSRTDATEADSKGIHPKFLELLNASRDRNGEGPLSGLHLHDWEGEPGPTESPLS